jgi:hypothetical protein
VPKEQKEHPIIMVFYVEKFTRIMGPKNKNTQKLLLKKVISRYYNYFHKFIYLVFLKINFYNYVKGCIVLSIKYKEF